MHPITLSGAAAAAALLALSPRAASAQERALAGADVKAHVGERATVCGTVVGTKYLEKSPMKLTFLNFDRAYPNQTFTAVIYPEVRARFTAAPDSAFLNKRLCVTGPITLYRDAPQIVVASEKDVTVRDAR